MVRFLLIFFQVALVFLSGCARERMDRAVPLPTPPEVKFHIERIAVLPFSTDNTVPESVREKIYHSFIDYLIKRRKVFVVHPKIIERLVNPDKPIVDPQKAAEIVGQLGVDGIVIGFLSDFRADPKRISFDATLYPIVNTKHPLCSGHRTYDSNDKFVIKLMKAYAKRFSWYSLPLGWERTRIKLDIFCDFVAWNMVNTFF